MSTDGRTIKIPISSEFFVFHFLLLRTAPTDRESYYCGRLPGDVVKRSINSNPLNSRVHTAAAMGGWRSQRESEKTVAVFPAATYGGG